MAKSWEQKSCFHYFSFMGLSSSSFLLPFHNVTPSIGGALKVEGVRANAGTSACDGGWQGEGAARIRAVFVAIVD